MTDSKTHRIANIGTPRRGLLMPEPALEEQLPCQEKEWSSDYGEHNNVCFTLSAPPDCLGRYASVVQASYLLSRVLRHVTNLPINLNLQQEEMAQLEKTIYAQIAYSESNTGTTLSIICYQKAISFWSVDLVHFLWLFTDSGNKCPPNAIRTISLARGNQFAQPRKCYFRPCHFCCTVCGRKVSSDRGRRSEEQ
jgi:hypothetical protein